MISYKSVSLAVNKLLSSMMCDVSYAKYTELLFLTSATR